jgi:hypothetical protein
VPALKPAIEEDVAVVVEITELKLELASEEEARRIGFASRPRFLDPRSRSGNASTNTAGTELS